MEIVLHEGSSFLVAHGNGDLMPGDSENNGLFFDDARFLSEYRLHLDGQSPRLLTARAESESEATFFLASPALGSAPPARLAIVRRQELRAGFRERLSIENFGDGEIRFELSLRFASDFENIFVVKNRAQSERHVPGQAEVERRLGSDPAVLELALKSSQVDRVTRIEFSRAPAWKEEEAVFEVRLGRRETYSLEIRIAMATEMAALPSPRRSERPPPSTPAPPTEDPWLAKVFRRAAADLDSLRFKAGDAVDEGDAIAAGIPWYMALFGRDSLIASYQSLATDPTLARGTLRALARLQGSREDRVSLEAPGKILHEYRKGKFLAGEERLIPKFPYYGSVDATPLFLIVLAEFARAVSDPALAHELWPHVERALAWLDASRDGEGFITYSAPSGGGLVNQGWKDSTDSVRFRDGRVAQGPIALVEVQGYAYAARRKIAELADALGKPALARELRASAATLRERLLSRYWLEPRGYFAEALDGEGHPVDALTSNPGHLLWCEALPPELARKVADRLVSEELFSGYGIRTMATTERGYNPISYHNGSVWPHENSLIIEGLIKYGFHAHAATLLRGLLTALRHYPDHRFPELFSGFSADRFGIPVEYPSACRPQAWASGAVLLAVRQAEELKRHGHDVLNPQENSP